MYAAKSTGISRSKASTRLPPPRQTERFLGSGSRGIAGNSRRRGGRLRVRASRLRLPAGRARAHKFVQAPGGPDWYADSRGVRAGCVQWALEHMHRAAVRSEGRMGGAGEEAAGRGRLGLERANPPQVATGGGARGRARRGLALPAVACVIIATFPGVLGDGRLGFVGQGLSLPRGAGLRAGSITRGAAGGVGAVAMSGDGDSGRLFNSRRLGAWADRLGEGETRLMGSRRVAKGLHFLLRRGKESNGGSQQQTAEVRPGGLADAPAAVSERDPADKVEVDAGPSEEEGEVGFKKEWGTINPVGATPPRPAGLITLNPEEEARLLTGERVQRQERNGRVGTGSVVVDVKADISTVFAVLTDLERYVERIHTVRRCTISERGAKVAKAQFALSRFNLVVNTVLRCDREANMLRFELDEERGAPMINESEGFWFLEEAPGRGGEYTRVWLQAGITCSSLLPTFLVDYAASRALPRATSWLKPTIEAIFKELPEGCGDVKGVVCGHQCEGCVDAKPPVEGAAAGGG